MFLIWGLNTWFKVDYTINVESIWSKSPVGNNAEDICIPLS
jgi:hypothetical protein